MIPVLALLFATHDPYAACRLAQHPGRCIASTQRVVAEARAVRQPEKRGESLRKKRLWLQWRKRR